MGAGVKTTNIKRFEVVTDATAGAIADALKEVAQGAILIGCELDNGLALTAAFRIPATVTLTFELQEEQ